MKPINIMWRQRFLCCLALLLSIGSHAAYKPSPGDTPKKEIAKGKPVKPFTNDPIRIMVSANKSTVAIGEEVELTITAQLLNIPSSVMFFAEGSNKFTLKVIHPKGFIVTGGTYTDYIGDELQTGRKSEVSYIIKGYFESVADGTSFRVLRGGKNANAQSLFVEKAALHIGTPKTEQSKNQVAIQDKPATIGLIVRDIPHTFNAVAAFSQCIQSEAAGVTASSNASVQNYSNAIGGQVRGPMSNANEYATYTITGITTAGVYTLTLRYASGDSPTIGVQVNGGTVQSVALATTSGWNTFTTKTISVNLNANTNNTIRIQGASGTFLQDQICVDGGTTTNCDFNITATTSNPNPTCGALISLGAPCSGANCTGVTYAWTGPGMSASLQNPSVTVPNNSNGTFTYNVTASLAGCSSKAASVNVTVSGCSTSSTFSQCIQSEAAGVTASSNASVQNYSNAIGGQVRGPMASANEYATYSITNVPSAGTYTLTLRYASGDSPTIGVQVNGGTVQSVALATTSGWNTFTTKDVSVNLNAGANTIRIQGASGTFLQDQICVNSITTTPCDFAITATTSNGNPACNGAITLNAPCTGANCSGVTYVWSGQGLSSTSQSPNLTVPGSNGTFTYSVTASKSSCTSKTASVNVTVSNCPTTATNYRDMGRAGTQKEYINISVSISNGTAYLTDAVGYTGETGYNLLYFINDIYVGTSLNSYPVPTNGKYVVDKLYTRDTPISGYARVMDLWKAQPTTPALPTARLDWIRLDQGRHQQVVSTYDAATASATEVPTSDNKGMLLPVNQPWFIKSNNWNAQALKDGPAKTLPSGKIWGGIPQDGVASMTDYRAKGWNAFRFPNYTYNPWYSNVNWNNEGLLLVNAQAFKEAVGASFTNEYPPYNQGITGANNNGNRNYKYQFDEFEEDDNPKVNYESDGYIGYWQGLKQANLQGKLFGSYGQSRVRYHTFNGQFQPAGGGSRNPLEYLTYKRLYASQADARQRAGADRSLYPDFFYQTRYGGNSFSSLGMEQLIQVYPTQVNDVDLPYTKMHEMDIMLKQDLTRRPIGWLWPWRESHPTTISGAVLWDHETTSPAGRVLRSDYQIHGLIIPEVFAFDMMVRGQGIVFWNNNYQQSDDRNKIENTINGFSISWFPNSGSPASFPYTTTGSQFNKPSVPLVGYDAAHQGRDKAIRALEYLGTSTPAWEYATYSLNGVARTAPSDGSAILQHANDYKPMAMILSNPANGKKVVWAFDPYCAPNLSQTMVVNLPSSQTITINLKGNGLHVVLVN